MGFLLKEHQRRIIHIGYNALKYVFNKDHQDFFQ